MFVADLHFSEKPPAARKVESDWRRVWMKYLEQLHNAWLKYYKPPIFIAGDIMEWNSPPCVISDIIRGLRHMEVYAIYGNHDLPNHNAQQFFRSAFWTLVEADTIKFLDPVRSPHAVGNMNVWAFPFGTPVVPIPYQSHHSLMLDIALVHDYIWARGHGFRDAPEEKRLGNYVKKLQGYDVAVFGDNHRPFTQQLEGHCKVLNCGTFMRRHLDEKDIKPSIGLLHADGTLSRHYLNTSQDKFVEVVEEQALEDILEVKLTEFAQELQDAHGGEKMDFVKIALHMIEKDKLPPEIKTIVVRNLCQQSGK